VTTDDTPTPGSHRTDTYVFDGQTSRRGYP